MFRKTNRELVKPDPGSALSLKQQTSVAVREVNKKV